MRVRRFVAPTIPEALSQVKAALGHDAIILQAQRRRRRGLLGLFGRAEVEVIAASAADPLPLAKVPGGTANEPAPVGRSEGHRSRGAPTPLAGPRRSQGPVATVPVRPTAPARPLTLPVDWPPVVEGWYRRLLAQEVEASLARQLLSEVLRETDGRTEPQTLHTALYQQMTASLPAVAEPESPERPRLVALVGPTGVGKTTTIAKLAARQALFAGQRVALVTLDTYRIAAAEQLRTYAEIMGLPVSVCFSSDELRAAVAREQGADLILIDTAGRSQRNTEQMRELQESLAALPGLEVHLVVSATTRFNDLMEILERFRPIGYDALVVTKLDETSTYGLLYNAARLSGRPVAYLSTGQNVPDDLEVAQPSRLVELILGGGA